jgi:hypothetical protein
VNAVIREHGEVTAFKRAAERLCLLLEQPTPHAQRWAEATLAALALLYASAHALPDWSLPDEWLDVPESLDVSDDEWRQVFDRVHRILGPPTSYWAHFDPSEPSVPGEPACGDLGDDLADIYRDVKPGVRAWDSGDDRLLPAIVFGWKGPLFESHWGVHAVSAMRALHPIAFLRGLQDGP